MSTMNLSHKEKECIKLLREITQVDYKTIHTVFRGLHLINLLYYYSNKKSNEDIGSKLKNLPITIPYLLSFDATVNMHSAYDLNVDITNLTNINYSKDLRDALRSILDNKHTDIRETLVSEIGDIFKEIMGLTIPDETITDG